MAVRRSGRNEVYGITNASQFLSTPPIISQRAPTVNDTANLGTIWIFEPSNAYYILTSLAGGSATWVAQTAGSGSFPTVEVTGGAGTVLTVDAGGDTSLGGALDVSGVATFAGNIIVNGDAQINGDFDISSNSAISFISMANANPSILLETNGGVTEVLELANLQGTAADSIYVHSDAGGIVVDAAGAIDINSSAGVINIGNDAVAQNINVGTGAAARTITVGNVSGATAVAINSGTGHITLTSTGSGDIILNSDDTMLLDADGVLELNSSAGAISIGNDADAQNINIGTGAAARVITVGNVTGATQVVLNSGSAGVAVTGTNGAITVASGTGAINVSADAAATTVNLGTGAGVKAVTLGSTNTTSSTVVQSGTGDVAVTSADAILLDAVGVLELNSSAGVIGIGNDAVAQNINIGTGAAARVVTIGNVTGASQVVLNSGTAGVAINTTGAGDVVVTSADTVLIDAAGVLELNSSAGVIGIGNDAVAQNINIGTGAAERIVTIGNVTGASQVVLNSGTAGVAINTTGAGDVVVTSADTVLIDSAGVLELNSSGAAINIGNDAVAQAINIGTGASDRDITIGNTTASTTINLNMPTGTFAVANTGFQLTNSSGPSIRAGTGSPNTVVTAAKGSVFLRTDGASADEVLYVNTDGTTAWTALTST